MKVLSVSTSSPILSVALSENSKKISSFHKELGLKHSANLMNVVEKILNNSNLNIYDIDLFVVDSGPGSFTGIRIGMTAIKTVAKVLKKSVVSVSSLDIIGYGLKQQKQVYMKCIILDAKRNKVYAGLYNSDKRYFLVNIDELIRLVDKDVIFAGDAVALYKEKINKLLNKNIHRKFSEISFWYPDAFNLCKLGIEKFNKEGSENIDTLKPLYFYSKYCQTK